MCHLCRNIELEEMQWYDDIFTRQMIYKDVNAVFPIGIIWLDSLGTCRLK